MPGGGLALCLISNDKTWQDQIISLIEKGVQNQLTFFVNETAVKDPKAWVWYWHVVDNCNIVICDMASCSEHEIRVALAMSKIDHPVIFYVKPGNEEFISLLKAVDIAWFDDLEDLPNVLEALFG
jgi:hypothetical protein